MHKKKEPGVAALNARAAATTAAEKESEEDKKPKLVFTMGKRAPKVAPVVVKAAEEETFGYADTVVGYASTETKAPEPEAAPEAEAKAEPVEEAPAPVEEDASQGKKEVKRPKRPVVAWVAHPSGKQAGHAFAMRRSIECVVREKMLASDAHF